jgi:hypothetical protein
LAQIVQIDEIVQISKIVQITKIVSIAQIVAKVKIVFYKTICIKLDDILTELRIGLLAELMSRMICKTN